MYYIPFSHGSGITKKEGQWQGCRWQQGNTAFFVTAQKPHIWTHSGYHNMYNIWKTQARPNPNMDRGSGQEVPPLAKNFWQYIVAKKGRVNFL